MKQIFQLILLIGYIGFATSSFAQYDTASYDLTTHPVILGDIDTLGYWMHSDGGCKAAVVRLEPLPGNPFSLATSGGWFVAYPKIYFILHSVSVGLISAPIHATVERESIPGACGGGEENWTFNLTARVISDSQVLIRPRGVNSTMRPDTIKGGWTSPPLSFTLKNKVALRTSFSRFRLFGAPDTNLTFLVYRNGQRIDSVAAAPLDDTITLQLQLFAKKGPIFDVQTLPQMSLGIHVHNSDLDSEYMQGLQMQMSPAPHNFRAYADPGSIDISAFAGVDSIREIVYHKDPGATKVFLGPIDYPLHFDTVDMQDSLRIRVVCHGSTAAWYQGNISIYSIGPDFDGDARLDSTLIPMRATIAAPNETASWIPIAAGLDTITQIRISTKGAIYISDGKRLLASDSSGNSWQELPASDISDFVVDSSGAIYKLSQGLFWVSHDQAQTWRQIDLAKQAYLYPQYRSILLNGSDEIFLEGTILEDSRKPQRLNELFYTQHGKSSWSTELLASDPGRILAIDSIGTIYWGSGKTATISHSRDVFESQGESKIFFKRQSEVEWRVSSNLITGVRSMASTAVGRVYIVTVSNGVFVSSDDGAKWEGANGGLPQLNAQIACAQPNGYVFLGTRGSGLFRSKSIERSSVQETQGFTRMLGHNFPNPATGNTVIGFTLSTRGHVRIAVIDPLGREVASPLDADENAGEHEVLLNTAKLPNGVYTYSLQCDGARQTRNMVVLR